MHHVWPRRALSRSAGARRAPIPLHHGGIQGDISQIPNHLDDSRAVHGRRAGCAGGRAGHHPSRLQYRRHRGGARRDADSRDLSLFDVTKLAAAAPGPSAHIPVQLTFAAGLTPTAPAGVTFSAVSGESATGYLTPDSGRAFAQALRDAIKADLAAGHQAGTAPVFGALTSMAALGATTPVQPYYPLRILRVNTLDSTGAPSNALVILFNTDNFRTFNAAVSSRQGVIRVAVPAGNYSAMSFDFVVDPETKTTKFILVTQDGITVPATGRELDRRRPRDGVQPLPVQPRGDRGSHLCEPGLRPG